MKCPDCGATLWQVIQHNKEEFNVPAWKENLEKENQTLQNSLGLKELEAEELKGQIRALETQLTETEGKVEKAKQKLKNWKELIQSLK